MAEIGRDKWPWPRNVGSIGTYPEEVHQLKKLEKNPDAAPMPQVGPDRLLDPKKSSDNLRMGEPKPISEDPFEASQLELSHVVLRRLLMKRRRPSWGLFGKAVEQEELGELPESRREQMRAMLRRERAMLQMLERYNNLAEQVYSRLLSEAKG